MKKALVSRHWQIWFITSGGHYHTACATDWLDYKLWIFLGMHLRLKVKALPKKGLTGLGKNQSGRIISTKPQSSLRPGNLEWEHCCCELCGGSRAGAWLHRLAAQPGLGKVSSWSRWAQLQLLPHMGANKRQVRDVSVPQDPCRTPTQWIPSPALVLSSRNEHLQL